MVGGALLTLSSCDKDHPVLGDYLATMMTSDSEVTFELYSSIDSVNPLEVDIIVNKEAEVSYSWYKVRENDVDEIISQGKVNVKGKQ